MGLLNQLSGLLGKHAHPADASGNIESEFENAPKASPQNLTEAVMDAFRSDKTPPFGQLASQLFSKANPQEKSGLLNTLLTAVGPAILGQVGSQQGGLSGILSSFKGGAISPAQAEQVSPAEFEQLADQAAKQNPSVIDQVSQFVSKNPSLLKSLGATALSVAMGKLRGKGG